MNAALTTLYPLPAALFRPDPVHWHRRHRIGSFEIAEDALELFNRLLERLDLHRAPIQRDQLATAARDLVDEASDAPVAPCLYDRMRRAGAIDRMLGDRDWTLEDAIGARSRLVVEYVRDTRDLIPDTMPKVGRLDDAIVVDTAWPSLAPEVRSYLDFCRVRQIERELGGDGPFSRRDWERARNAEAQWIDHCRRVGNDSYLASPPAHFRVC